MKARTTDFQFFSFVRRVSLELMNSIQKVREAPNTLRFIVQKTETQRTDV